MTKWSSFVDILRDASIPLILSRSLLIPKIISLWTVSGGLDHYCG